MTPNCYPEWYQRWLFRALDVADGSETAPEILEPLERLNRGWVGGDGAGEYAEDPAAMRAYALFYMTINLPKLWLMMDRAPEFLDRLFAEGRPVRITEYGCGPATFLWAFTLYPEVWGLGA